MRIEINAGGMGKISVLSFEAAVAQSIAVTASVIDSFVEIENDTYALNGGVGDCQDAVDSIGARIQEEADRLDEELAFHREVEDFIALAIRVDNEVANELGDAKNEFYQMHPWAKPPVPEEKSWLDHLIEGLKSAAEFLGEIAKDAIVDGLSFLVEKCKGVIAFISDALGFIFDAMAFVATIAVIVAIAICSAPLVAAVGVASAIGIGIAAAIGAAALIASMKASGCYFHGMADEVREHGGNFQEYDMKALEETCWDVWTESFISNSIQFSLSVIFGITGISLSNVTGKIFTSTLFDPAALSMGKRLLVQTLYAFPGEIVENFLTNIIIDGVDGNGFDIGEDWKKTLSPEELFFSLIGAGAGAYADELKNMKELTDLANSVDVSTPKDGAITYSGTIDVGDQKIRARKVAEQYGRMTGKMTLEMTEGGKLFDGMNLYERYPKEFADDIFKTLSDRFSSQASGTINIVAERVNINSMFQSIETPNILEGIDTMRITEINLVLDKLFTIVP